MGLDVMLVAALAWAAVAVVAIAVIVLLCRRTLRHRLENRAAVPIVLAAGVASAASILAGRRILGSEAGEALPYALGFVLAFPLALGLLLALASVLAARSARERGADMAVAILHYAAIGALVAHFVNVAALGALF